MGFGPMHPHSKFHTCSRNLLHQQSIDANQITLSSVVRCAHSVASESAISDHVTLPELPEPDNATPAATQSQLVFSTQFLSSSSPCSDPFPHPSPLSGNRSYPTSSQAALLVTYQACLAEDPWITHIGLTIDNTWSCHHPSSHMQCTAFADRPKVRTDKKI